MSLVVAFRSGDKMVMASDDRTFLPNEIYIDWVIKIISAKNIVIWVTWTTYYMYLIRQFLNKPENIDIQINSVVEAQRFIDMLRKELLESHEWDEGADKIHSFSITLIMITNTWDVYQCGWYLDIGKIDKWFFAIWFPYQLALWVMWDIMHTQWHFVIDDTKRIFSIVKSFSTAISHNVDVVTLDIVDKDSIKKEWVIPFIHNTSTQDDTTTTTPIQQIKNNVGYLTDDQWVTDS